jgi:hypothetical protein
MEMPNNAANRFSILRHGCTGPMRCDVFILWRQITGSRGF